MLSMNNFVCLLRGINVGGKNVIKMTDLAACFEMLGFRKVRTYIQSGNVVFDSDEPDPAGLAGLIEVTLSKTFRYDSRVVVRSAEEVKEIVVQAPDGFGEDPSTYRYDVFFLKEPLTASQAITSITPREGVDQVWAGNHALYASRLISRASQSYLTRITGLPIYQDMTIRNWNTTTRLLKMMEEGDL